MPGVLECLWIFVGVDVPVDIAVAVCLTRQCCSVGQGKILSCGDLCANPFALCSCRMISLFSCLTSGRFLQSCPSRLIDLPTESKL